MIQKLSEACIGADCLARFSSWRLVGGGRWGWGPGCCIWNTAVVNGWRLEFCYSLCCRGGRKGGDPSDVRSSPLLCSLHQLHPARWGQHLCSLARHGQATQPIKASSWSSCWLCCSETFASAASVWEARGERKSYPHSAWSRRSHDKILLKLNISTSPTLLVESFARVEGKPLSLLEDSSVHLMCHFLSTGVLPLTFHSRIFTIVNRPAHSEDRHPYQVEQRSLIWCFGYANYKYN